MFFRRFSCISSGMTKVGWEVLGELHKKWRRGSAPPAGYWKCYRKSGGRGRTPPLRFLTCSLRSPVRAVGDAGPYVPITTAACDNPSGRRVQRFILCRHSIQQVTTAPFYGQSPSLACARQPPLHKGALDDLRRPATKPITPSGTGRCSVPLSGSDAVNNT